jgi:hypothetical protein
MSDPADRPLPLDMDDADVERVLNYIYLTKRNEDVSDRLLIEILDCLRRIDDKLGKVLIKLAEKKEPR